MKEQKNKEKQKTETKTENNEKDVASVKTENENAEQKKPSEDKKEVDNSETKAEAENKKLKKELKEKEDAFLRLAAEYDNFRKRSAKEKSDIYSSSKADVLNEILPIIDNFERAADNSQVDFDGYRKGIELIFNQFLNVLSKFGVESYAQVGDSFDPAIHSAVMTVQDDTLGENVIAEVFNKGYKLGDKIIREAVVKVANS